MLSKFFSKKEQNEVPGLLAISFDSKGIALAYQSEALAKPNFNICTYIQTDEGTDQLAVLKGFVDTNGLTGVSCSIVLSPIEYRLVFLDAPSLDDAELGAASKWLVKEFIDFPIEEAVVDAFRVPVRPGKPSKMYAVVAKIAHVKQRIELLEQAGLVTVCVDIAELALRNVMSYLEEGSKEVGLLMMQPDFHALLVSSEKTLCLSRAIETQIDYFPTVEHASEQEAALAHLVNEVERSVAYFQSHISKGDFAKIWISSLLSDQAKLIQSLSAVLTVPMDLLDLNQYFTFPEKQEIKKQVRTLLAIGGALRLGWTSNEPTN